MPADLVFLNGPVFISDANRSVARAVAVTDGRILAVGSEDEVSEHIGAQTEVVDLAGRLLTPGFQDAHVHPGSSGLDLLRCSLSDCDDASQALDAIARYAADRPDEPWIIGAGWSQDWFPRGCPAKELLDWVVPDRPVFLYNTDGHGAWVNSLALARRGIDSATADPGDGRIERNPDGSPQGTLHEGAANMMQEISPEDTLQDVRRGILAGQSYLLSKGITTWQDAHVDQLTHDAYRSLAASGELVGRAVGALWWDRRRGLDQIERFKEMRSEPEGGYQPLTVKLMLDGVIENGTASLLEPYVDGNATDTGIDFIAPQELNEIVVRLDALRFSCHFHAIGDAAVRHALDAVEAARATNGPSGNRHHIAHIQVVHPDDIPRFTTLGVTANAQALWAADGGYQTELTKPVIGPERSSWQYPFGSLLRAGATLAMGSDWGVSTANVLAQIDVAVNRSNWHEPDLPPLNPNERISFADALAGFTSGSAYVNHREADSGTVAVGKLADLVVLDRDPTKEEGPIRDTKVAMTIVGGQAVYEED
ncbi:MAG: amidohydrolase [Actinomycetota bacterium]|nr:amidohydrolase [Actinomycetota bacterium]